MAAQTLLKKRRKGKRAKLRRLVKSIFVRVFFASALSRFHAAARSSISFQTCILHDKAA